MAADDTRGCTDRLGEDLGRRGSVLVRNSAVSGRHCDRARGGWRLARAVHSIFLSLHFGRNRFS
eukprot:7382038-Prymnesium_polylepis.1